MASEQNLSLRDALVSGFDSAEEPQNLEAQSNNENGAADFQQNNDNQGDSVDRIRDEQGRFASKAEKQQVETTTQSEQKPVTANPDVQAAQEPQAQSAPEITFPTSWKKEPLSILQKAAAGQQLERQDVAKLAEYVSNREKEFATGVATYRAEAENAKHLTEAINPFIAELQQHNVTPAQWIATLGHANRVLLNGSPNEKLQMFAQLARDYNVPLAAVQGATQGDINPIVTDMMQQIQQMKEQLSQTQNWRVQQEQEAARREIAKFSDTSKYPHFEAVRGSMVQLLETGFASDPDDAYKKAVRLQADELPQPEASQTAQTAQVIPMQQQKTKQEVAAAARAAAVSTRPGSRTDPAKVDPKDLRGNLEAHFAALASGGRV